MKYCTCESCRFTFRYPILPPACIDCGEGPVRNATDEEIEDYHRKQKILQAKIMSSLYAGASA